MQLPSPGADVGNRDWVHESFSLVGLLYRFRIVLLAWAFLLTACSQTVDFDIRIVGTVDLDAELASALGAGTHVVDIPGGVVVPLEFSHEVDLLNLDSAFSSLLAGGSEVRLLAVRYEITENTASAIVPSLRFSVAPGITSNLDMSVLVGRLPAIQPGAVSKEAEIPWVPGGREHLETAMNSYVFTSFFSGSLTLREGALVPTGAVRIEILVTARTITE